MLSVVISFLVFTLTITENNLSVQLTRSVGNIFSLSHKGRAKCLRVLTFLELRWKICTIINN